MNPEKNPDLSCMINLRVSFKRYLQIQSLSKAQNRTKANVCRCIIDKYFDENFLDTDKTHFSFEGEGKI